MFPLKDNLRYLTFPWVTVSIVALNIFFFIGEMTAQRMGVLESVMHPWLLTRTELFTALGSGHPGLLLQALVALIVPMFLHQGFMHIFGNMCFFFAFAPAVEARLGHKKFAFFYLAAGIVASMDQCLTAANPNMTGLGASGAIGGVLGAYLVLFPRAEMEGWMPLSPIPLPFVSSAFFFLLDFIMQQVINIFLSAQGALSGEEASVGYAAHLGGIGLGMLVGLVVSICLRRNPPAVDPVVVPARPERARYLFEIMEDVPLAVLRWVVWRCRQAFGLVWFCLTWGVRMLWTGLKLVGRALAWVSRKTGITWLARRLGFIWLAGLLWATVRFCLRPVVFICKMVARVRLLFRKKAAAI